MLHVGSSRCDRRCYEIFVRKHERESRPCKGARPDGSQVSVSDTDLPWRNGVYSDRTTPLGPGSEPAAVGSIWLVLLQLQPPRRLLLRHLPPLPRVRAKDSATLEDDDDDDAHQCHSALHDSEPSRFGIGCAAKHTLFCSNHRTAHLSWLVCRALRMSEMSTEG